MACLFDANCSSTTNQSNQTQGITSTGNSSDYEYDYDYDYSVNNLNYGEVVPVALVYSLTLLLGILGNALVIFSILRYRRMQNVTNIFLTSLASADLLLVLLCVPIKLAKWFSFTWTFGEFLCKGVHYMQNVSVICSITTLTAISLERYYAILYPMKAKYICTKDRTRRVIALLWVMSFALATPITYGQIHKEVGNFRRKGYWCVDEWPTDWAAQIYATAMLVLVFIVPLSIMTFAYASISKEMWRMSANKDLQAAKQRRPSCAVTLEDDTTSTITLVSSNVSRQNRRVNKPVKDDTKTRKQVIKMLVAIIVLFAICWGPTFIDDVLAAYGVVRKLNYGHLKPMRQAFSLMAYSNSCVNPVVYAFMSKNFRRSFQTTFMSLIRRSYRPPAGVPIRQGSYQTRCTSSTALTPSRRASRCDCEIDMKEHSLGPSRYLHVDQYTALNSQHIHPLVAKRPAEIFPVQETQVP